MTIFVSARNNPDDRWEWCCDSCADFGTGLTKKMAEAGMRVHLAMSQYNMALSIASDIDAGTGPDGDAKRWTLAEMDDLIGTAKRSCHMLLADRRQGRTVGDELMASMGISTDR